MCPCSTCHLECPVPPLFSTITSLSLTVSPANGICLTTSEQFPSQLLQHVSKTKDSFSCCEALLYIILRTRPTHIDHSSYTALPFKIIHTYMQICDYTGTLFFDLKTGTILVYMILKGKGLTSWLWSTWAQTCFHSFLTGQFNFLNDFFSFLFQVFLFVLLYLCTVG